MSSMRALTFRNRWRLMGCANVGIAQRQPPMETIEIPSGGAPDGPLHGKPNCDEPSVQAQEIPDPATRVVVDGARWRSAFSARWSVADEADHQRKRERAQRSGASARGTDQAIPDWAYHRAAD